MLDTSITSTQLTDLIILCGVVLLITSFVVQFTE